MSDDEKGGHRNLENQKGRLFSFESDAYPASPFYVVEFNGTEAINAPYQFSLTLGSTQGDIDLEKILANPARFTMTFGGGSRIFRGEVIEADLVHFENNLFYFQFTFVSRFWNLGLTTLNEVYNGKSVKEIVESVLKEAGFTEADYAMELQSTYPALDFQFQYQESRLDFIHRLIEREGIYYYHREEKSGEKIVFTDSKTTHKKLDDPVYYRSDSDASVDADFPAFASLISKTRRIPKTYTGRDFDYGAATVAMEATASIDAENDGEILHVGGMLTGPKEKDVTKTPSNSERAKTLVDRWKEMMLCHRTLYHGEGTAHPVRPGVKVTVKSHFRDAMNKTYLPLSVSHKGSQTGIGFVDGRHALWRGSEKPFYRNDVLMIDGDTQFRPEHNTPKPVIAGTIPAFIDGAGDGVTAEVDSVGRYKVKFPYAKKTDRGPMKSSCWLRLATPYAGSDHGMHFPLHKGAEVAVAFFEGDPDRPYIAAALPDSVNPSVVTSANPAEARLMTGGQNLLSFVDTATKQRILLHSPTGESWVRVGSTHEDPHSHDPLLATKEKKEGEEANEEKPEGGIALDTEKDYRLFVKKNQYETTEGKRTTETTGANSETYKGGSTETYESCDLNQNIEHGRQNVDVTGNKALDDRLKTFRDNVKSSRDGLQSAAGGFKGFAIATAITGTLAAVAVLAAPFAAVASAGLVGGMIVGGFYLGMATAVSVVGGAITAAVYRSKREEHIKKVKEEITSLRTALKSAKGVYELKTPVRDVEVEALDHLEVGTATNPGQQVTKIEGEPVHRDQSRPD